MHRLPSILVSALAIPAAAALQLRKQLLIGHIARLHIDCLSCIFKRLSVIMQTSLRKRVQIIPACVAFVRRHAAKRIDRFRIMPGINVVFGSTHFNDVIIRLLLILALLSVAVTAEKLGKRIILILPLTAAVTIAAISARSLLLRTVISAAGTRSSALPSMHDLFVRLLNLHKAFFSLRRIRLSDIGVRMIDLTELAVCFFYLVVARRRRNAEYLIRICHDSFFAFLLSLACSNLIQMPE